MAAVTILSTCLHVEGFFGALFVFIEGMLVNHKLQGCSMNYLYDTPLLCYSVDL